MSDFRQHDATVRVRSFGVTLRNRQFAPPSAAGWHQLIYATHGVMTIHTGQGTWVTPSHRALWIPDGIAYRVDIGGLVALRSLYVRSRRADGLPRACAVVNVTPLLRELIVRIVEVGALDDIIPPQRRLAAVLLDELKLLDTVPLQLPWPQEPRAVRFAQAAGGASKPLADLLREAGASRRTMERLFRQETGMALGQWLRRQKLLAALHRLAAGETVSEVATTLGYSSPSAFTAMFRKELGHPPTAYREGL